MIKVLVPSMPSADELLPYLRRMDENRIYVNRGPLVRELEVELSNRLVMAPCTAVSNGTVALELALRAMNLPPGRVLVQAATFVGTALAIANAGHQPLLCDVDAAWQLSAEAASAAVGSDSAIRAVVPVATFGAPVRISPWERFAERTGLPVLIDAAGAIRDQAPSANPRIAIAYSLHATKSLGAGEGGVLASQNAGLIERVASLAIFGPGGTNAKMSEYHAAVALASLRRCDSWRTDVDRWYTNCRPGGLFFKGAAPQRARTLLPVLLPYSASAEVVQEALAAADIETKQWYRPFVDERSEFFMCPKIGPMRVTEALRARMLGLPYHRYLTERDVSRVCSTLAGIVG